MRIDRLFRAVAAALLAASPAGACTISATGVTFGAYDPTSASNDDGTGSVALACPPSVSAPVVALEGGAYGSIAARRMRSGVYFLNYNLFTDPTRLILWGNGALGSTVTLSGGTVTAGQRNFSRNIYGRIPAGQNVGAGTYGDTLVVTVIF